MICCAEVLCCVLAVLGDGGRNQGLEVRFCHIGKLQYFICAYLYACSWAMQGPHVGRKGERAGTSQPGEAKAQEDLFNVYKYSVYKRIQRG